MFGICMIIYLVLTVVAAVVNSLGYRKNNDMNPSAFLVCLAAGIVFFVGFLSLGDSSSSGSYIYYINGQRVGAGSINFSMGLFCGFMSMVFSWFLSWGIGYLFGYRNKQQKDQKPSVAKLILSIWGALVGITGILCSANILINNNFKSSAMMNAYFISILIFVIILALSILGVVRYIKGKKSCDKGKTNR